MTTNLEWMHDNDRERLRLDLECGPCEGCRSTPDPSKTFCEWLMAEHEEETYRDEFYDCDSTVCAKDEPEDEPDTREKLEADVRQYANPGGGKGTIGALWEKKMLGFLDRQREITMRECERICDSCEWPSLAAQPDKEAYDLIEHQRGQIMELKAIIEKQNAKVSTLNGELSAARMSRAHFKRQSERLEGQLKEFEDMRYNMLAALGLIAEA